MKKTTLSIAACCLVLSLVFAQKSFLKNSLAKIVEENKLVKSGVDDIHVHMKGNGQTIVFVSDLGEDHKDWQPLQDSLSAFAQTISYDRSGIGKSSYKFKRKDLPSLAWELRRTLQSAKAAKPYILTGFSFGCQVVKQFAAMFPDEVKAMIFIDPAYNEQKLQLSLNDSVWEQRQAAQNHDRPKIGAARDAEIAALNKNCAIADDIIKLPAVPVVLFTSTKINTELPGAEAELKVKQQTHELWLNSMANAKHIETAESAHDLLIHSSQTVIDEIVKML